MKKIELPTAEQHAIVYMDIVDIMLAFARDMIEDSQFDDEELLGYFNGAKMTIKAAKTKMKRLVRKSLETPSA